MRLFKVENDAIVDEVGNGERLAGIYDAIHVARHLGDGHYDADFGDGTVMRFEVQDGQAFGVGPQNVRTVNIDDMPHREWDRQLTQQTTRSTISAFGGMFDEVEPEDNSENAYDEF